MRTPFLLLTSIVPLFPMSASFAQETNYDESRVPGYELPNPFVMLDGTRVTSVADWRERRRPEILSALADHVYGRTPGLPPAMRFEVTEADGEALGGAARRRQVTIHFDDREIGPKLHLLIYRPTEAEASVPAFLGLNFYGNHSIADDPAITLSTAWMRNSSDKGVVDHRATEESRGTSRSRWPVDLLVSRGYALVTAYYGDLDPDWDDGFSNGVHPLFEPPHSERPLELWGAIGAWAWGLSRALDYLETDRDVDATRVAVLGHSRLGKTALWAGAQDERFALVVSNESGCGGAALSRRRFGETIEHITNRFPHWFCGRFWFYRGKEDELPVDQHLLIAAIAPRPVYVASAADDRWADPKGEFLALLHAEPVYRFLGAGDLGTSDQPPVDHPVHGSALAYHVRSGPHDLRRYDWEQFLDFADRVIR